MTEMGKKASLDLERLRLMLLQKWLIQDIETENKELYLPSTRFQVSFFL